MVRYLTMNGKLLNHSLRRAFALRYRRAKQDDLFLIRELAKPILQEWRLTEHRTFTS